MPKRNDDEYSPTSAQLSPGISQAMKPAPVGMSGDAWRGRTPLRRTVWTEAGPLATRKTVEPLRNVKFFDNRFFN